jgi:hypothetical protein
MSYDSNGRYLGIDFVPDERCREFRAYRDAAMAQAEPFAQWWATYGE